MRRKEMKEKKERNERREMMNEKKRKDERNEKERKPTQPAIVRLAVKLSGCWKQEKQHFNIDNRTSHPTSSAPNLREGKTMDKEGQGMKSRRTRRREKFEKQYEPDFTDETNKVTFVVTALVPAVFVESDRNGDQAHDLPG
jgi:hypothetical protein